MAFVHLHNHTEYSLLDGLTHVRDMVRRAAELDMPAVAITDHGVMSGVPELDAECAAVLKDTGKSVKPIFGCEVYFTTDEELKRDHKPKLYHLLLLAKTNEGYHNLVKLVTESHVGRKGGNDNYYYKPRTTLSMLKKYGRGIIGTSACVAGIVPRLIDVNQLDEARQWATRLRDCFEPGDFYIELQNQGIMTNNGMSQTELNGHLTRIAQEIGCETIATNDFHYLLKEDAPAQDLLLCIGTNSIVNDANRMRFPNDQFYMKTEEEMREAMRDFPEACDNTVKLAEKCNVQLEHDSILPKFPLPEGESEESWFRHKCEEGLERRYGKDWKSVVVADNTGKEKSVLEQYEYEAGIIIQQGFPAYFLIVQEYIEWARSQGIGVGPGRGSAAGAIVAYAMGITDIDPLPNGLMFERFLSPERVEMPDIDVDFEQGRREEVINHIKEVYGEDHVSQVITFGAMKAKNAVRDAARVLDFPYALGDKICKLIGDEINITIDDALKDNPDFAAAYKQEEDVRIVVDAAKSIEGHVRGEGVHACATIICRDPMDDHVPLKRDTKGGGIITQYDGHYTPELGLLKMDFLGLRTLDVLSEACRNVKLAHGVEIKPEDIPIDDAGAFEIMRQGNMDGLFQVESSLYVELFRRLPPKDFSNVVASIALNRPGPLGSGMVDDYVNVAIGKAAPNYYDDRLKPILEETYGTIVYQEQIMQISMVMSGFSAGKADRLRKAMGKKKIDIMRQLKDDWESGAIENGYKIEVAKQIWQDAEKFAEYAFNKSHSAAYAILVMRTAYLKAHYPFEYMAAVLSSYMTSADKLIRYVASCNQHGTPVMPPDINSSNADFTPVGDCIRFGLVGVRGVGRAVADQIIEEREAGGPYTSLHDFVNRLDSKCYNRKTLEALIKSGAFDSTGYTRKQLMHIVDETKLLENASKRQRDKNAGQTDLFAMFSEVDPNFEKDDVPEPDGIEWDKRTKLAFEKEIMKMYVSEHPLSPYQDLISRVSQYQMADLQDLQHDVKQAVFVGMVSGVNVRLTKRNTKMATFNLEDQTGSTECITFDYEKYSDCIQEDYIVKIKGKFERSERRNQIKIYDMETIELREEDLAPIDFTLHVYASELDCAHMLKLQKLCEGFKGADNVILHVSEPGGGVYRVKLSVGVDARDAIFRSEVHNLFGRNVLSA